MDGRSSALFRRSGLEGGRIIVGKKYKRRKD